MIFHHEFVTPSSESHNYQVLIPKKRVLSVVDAFPSRSNSGALTTDVCSLRIDVF